jgi:hypothetical protein
MTPFLIRFKEASVLSLRRVGAGYHHARLHSPPALRERIAVNHTAVFMLQIAVGATACAGTILALFAWSGASL